jgi:hypothetical protein
MPDPLGRLRPLAEKRDRERARPSRIEPERLILAQRPPATTRRICLDCRRTPDALQLRNAWYATFTDPWAETTHPWPGIGPDCPYCGGQLIEVTG